MKPTKVEFRVGVTRFGQGVWLIMERGTDGVEGWTLKREAASQRDDTVYIAGLSADVIKAMAEAVAGVPRGTVR